MARRTQMTVLSIAAALCLGATVIITAQVFLKLDDYRAAYSDNIQWTVAKLEVEHAKYIHAIENLSPASTTSLAHMRRRFDIYYSRVDTISTAETYQKVLSGPRARDLVTTLRDGTHAQAALIDGPDASVYQQPSRIARDGAQTCLKPCSACRVSASPMTWSAGKLSGRNWPRNSCR